MMPCSKIRALVLLVLFLCGQAMSVNVFASGGRPGKLLSRVAPYASDQPVLFLSDDAEDSDVASPCTFDALNAYEVSSAGADAHCIIGKKIISRKAVFQPAIKLFVAYCVYRI